MFIKGPWLPNWQKKQIEAIPSLCRSPAVASPGVADGLIYIDWGPSTLESPLSARAHVSEPPCFNPDAETQRPAAAIDAVELRAYFSPPDRRFPRRGCQVLVFRQSEGRETILRRAWYRQQVC